MNEEKELSYTDMCKCAAIHALRVNVKTLAVESKVIRKEMLKTSSTFVKSYLNNHRINVLRSEARHTQLALAAVRGKPYIEIEPKTTHPPDFDRVRAKARKYIWYRKDKEKIDKWIEIAKRV